MHTQTTGTDQCTRALPNHCDMCSNPYPFNCEQCVGVIQQAMHTEITPKRINVGSGEDCVMAWF